jgi:hypothetical protein
MKQPHKRKPFVAETGTLKNAPDVAQALGELTARWSHMELLLVFVLQKLTKTTFDKASAVMYAVNATSARFDIINTVAKRLPKSDPMRSAVLNSIEACIALSSRRNALVHQLWVVEEPSLKAYTMDYRAEGQAQARKVRRTSKSIMAFCDEIMLACDDLEKIGDAPVHPTFEAAFNTLRTI